MKIINVRDLDDIDAGIKFVLTRAIIGKFRKIKKVLCEAQGNELPRCYICIEDSVFIGFLILSYDKEEDNKPFPFMLAQHIDIEFRLDNLAKLYEFAKAECKLIGAFNLAERLDYSLIRETQDTRELLEREKR